MILLQKYNKPSIFKIKCNQKTQNDIKSTFSDTFISYYFILLSILFKVWMKIDSQEKKLYNIGISYKKADALTRGKYSLSKDNQVSLLKEAK